MELQHALAMMAAWVVILTAGYILWTIQRVYLGPEYKGPHAEALSPMSLREIAIAAPLVVMAIVLGVYPRAMLDYSTPTINRLVNNLTQQTLTKSVPLAPWERAGVRGTLEQAGFKNSGPVPASPHPNPLPKGEGTAAGGVSDNFRTTDSPKDVSPP